MGEGGNIGAPNDSNLGDGSAASMGAAGDWTALVLELVAAVLIAMTGGGCIPLGIGPFQTSRLTSNLSAYCKKLGLVKVYFQTSRRKFALLITATTYTGFPALIFSL